MIKPVRYAGKSGSISQAKANMSAGPTSQLRTSEGTMSRLLEATRPSSP